MQGRHAIDWESGVNSTAADVSPFQGNCTPVEPLKHGQGPGFCSLWRTWPDFCLGAGTKLRVLEALVGQHQSFLLCCAFPPQAVQPSASLSPVSRQMSMPRVVPANMRPPAKAG